MTYTQVQSAFFNGSPPTVTWGSTPTKGHLLRCLVIDQTSVTEPTVSDTANGNWTLMNSVTGNTQGIWEFAVLAATSQPLTVSVSQGSDSLDVFVEEWSGNFAALTGITDQVGSAVGASNVATTSGDGCSITTSGPYSAGDLVLTAIAWNGNVTAPACTGYTQDAAWPTGAVKAASFYQVASAVGTFTPVITWTTSRKFLHLVTAYLPAAFPALAASMGATGGAGGKLSGIASLGAAVMAGRGDATAKPSLPFGHTSAELGAFSLGAMQLGGSVAVPPSALQGQMGGSGGVGAALIGTVRLSASIGGRSGMSGGLSGVGNLTAHVSGAGNASGTLAAVGVLSAEIGAAGNMAAELLPPLSVSMGGTGGMTGSLTAVYIGPIATVFVAQSRPLTFEARGAS